MLENEAVLDEEQEVYDNEELIYKLQGQIRNRKVATFIFVFLSAVCLIARLVAL